MGKRKSDGDETKKGTKKPKVGVKLSVSNGFARAEPCLKPTEVSGVYNAFKKAEVLCDTLTRKIDGAGTIDDPLSCVKGVEDLVKLIPKMRELMFRIFGLLPPPELDVDVEERNYIEEATRLFSIVKNQAKIVAHTSDILADEFPDKKHFLEAVKHADEVLKNHMPLMSELLDQVLELAPKLVLQLQAIEGTDTLKVELK